MTTSGNGMVERDIGGALFGAYLVAIGILIVWYSPNSTAANWTGGAETALGLRLAWDSIWPRRRPLTQTRSEGE